MPPTFAELGVPAALTDVLELRGIAEPFPIQAATLPDALAGRDVCGKAPTGSGKTLAFGLPLAARVSNAAPKRPKGLVLVPTRELAAQVRDELAPLLRAVGRSVHAFYGGVGFGPQLNALRKGVDVVVACPGRLADLVQRGDVRLDRVTFVVVDEADRMADMGFLPEVRRLLDQVHPDRQTLLFSATLDGAIGTLIQRYQRNPSHHGVERDEDLPVNRHVLWRAERDTRVALTAEVVSAHWPAIVFSRTKHGADRLVRQLGKLGVDAEAIHGNRSQGQRERALRSFTTGRAQALVATDVAARGIHVDGVACVVHFDAPPDPKDFVHRSGRTGRAGAEGLVVTLAPAAEARAVAKMMRQAGVEAELTVPDMSVLADGAPPPARFVPVAETAREDTAGAREPGGRSPGSSRARGGQPRREGQPSRGGQSRRGETGRDGRASRDDDRRHRSDGGGPRRRRRKGQSGGQDRLGLDGQPTGDRSSTPGRQDRSRSKASGRPGGPGAGRSGGGGRPDGGKRSGGGGRSVGGPSRSGGGGRSGGGPSRSGGGGRSGGGSRSGRR